MRTLLLALLLVCASLSAASAQIANPLVADGLRHLEHLRYVEAREAFTKALNSEGSSRQEMLIIYSSLGSSSAALGDAEGAAEAFDKLLSIEPSYELPGDSSPKLRAPFDEARERAKLRKPLKLAHQAPEPVIGEGVELPLQIANDPMKLIAKANAWYRLAGDSEWQKLMLRADKEKAELTFRLPRDFLQQARVGTRIEYFLEATDAHGGVLGQVGKRDVPLILKISAAREARREESEGPVVEKPPETDWREVARPAGFVLGAASGVALVAAMVVGGTASSKNNELKLKLQGAKLDGNGAITSPTRAEALELQGAAQSRASLANGLLLGAAVGTVVATVLLIVSNDGGGGGGDGAVQVGAGSIAISF